jgi:hypothetical protein
MLQMIGVSFGLKNPFGGTELLAYDMHNVSPKNYKKGERVAKNLTFFPEGKFQKSAFWISGASYGEPKCLKACINDYNTLDS